MLEDIRQSAVAAANEAVDFWLELERLGGYYGHQTYFPDEFVEFAASLIDRSGVVAQVEDWTRADREARQEAEGIEAKGGHKPKSISLRAALVVLLLLALSNEPLLISTMVATIRMRLSPEAAAALGIKVEPLDPTLSKEEARKVHRKWYMRAKRTVQALLRPIDPEFHQRRTLMTNEEFEDYKSQLNPELVALRVKRLDWVVNRLVQATIDELPRDIRRRWNGAVCVDATVMRLWARYRGDDSPYVSIEPNAGLYLRTNDGQSLDDLPEGKVKNKQVRKFYWSNEATFLVMGADRPELTGELPALAVSMVVWRTGTAVSGCVQRCADQFLEGGFTPSWLASDRAYFPNLQAEDFQVPFAQAGFRLIGDYRKDQLGSKDNYAGMMQVEGNWYCPGMPENLINATIDLRAKTIDQERYDKLIEQRRSYAMRPKTFFDDGRIAWACPAAGPSPTARCALKPESETDKTLGKTRIRLLPEHPDKVCTNKSSVTTPPGVGAKYGQEMAYATPEHYAQYTALRQRVESFNSHSKDPAKAQLEEGGRRRSRGLAFQSLAAALMVMASNIDKIRSFLLEVVQNKKGELERLFRRTKPRESRSRKSGRRSRKAAETLEPAKT